MDGLSPVGPQASFIDTPGEGADEEWRAGVEKLCGSVVKRDLPPSHLQQSLDQRPDRLDCRSNKQFARRAEEDKIAGMMPQEK